MLAAEVAGAAGGRAPSQPETSMAGAMAQNMTAEILIS
jgi:hypothetical protein